MEDQLEEGDLPLEKSLELFEQGIRLSRECQERLGQAERRIEMLMRDGQGRTVVSSRRRGSSDTLTATVCQVRQFAVRVVRRSGSGRFALRVQTPG